MAVIWIGLSDAAAARQLIKNFSKFYPVRKTLLSIKNLVPGQVKVFKNLDESDFIFNFVKKRIRVI